MSKIDNRILLVAVLVVGLVVGYLINGSFVSGPQIASITKTTEIQKAQIDDLVSSKTGLEDDIATLQNSYNDLEASTNQEITNLELEVSSLNEEIDSQGVLIDMQKSSLDDMQALLNELSYNNTILKEKYTELYNPLVSEFTINSLKFRVSVLDDRYPDNFPIEGTVEISYLNGDKFDGTFKLEIIKVYILAGSSSPTYNIIDGATNYKWTGAFALGPGSYKLNLSEVKDSNGVSVVSNSDLKKYPIYIFMG